MYIQKFKERVKKEKVREREEGEEDEEEEERFFEKKEVITVNKQYKISLLRTDSILFYFIVMPSIDMTLMFSHHLLKSCKKTGDEEHLIIQYWPLDWSDVLTQGKT